MALILVIVAVARNQYLSGLDPSRSKPANAAVIDTISAGLLDTVRTVLVLSALAALIAFLVGNATVRRFFANRSWPAWTTSGRAHDFVSAHRGALQWSALGIALFILVVWNNPTLLVAVVVVLVALAVVGLIGLWGRRTTTASVEPARRAHCRRRTGRRSGRHLGSRPGVTASGEPGREWSDARVWWQSFEPIHAVVYFADECRAALAGTGLRGFWMGYFAGRAVPLGTVGPATVSALFFSFDETMVRRALPDAWRFAEPDAVERARRESAATVLRRVCRNVEGVSEPAIPVIEHLVERADGSGRALFCANRDLPASRRPGGGPLAGVHLPP